jgi:hypothetical protein
LLIKAKNQIHRYLTSDYSDKLLVAAVILILRQFSESMSPSAPTERRHG